jgi:ferric-dicitrate binding protein FerR (iron transport regulator)
MTPEFAQHDALIVRSLQGTATPADEQRLAILLESAAFRRHHEATARLWTLTAGERARQQGQLPVPSEVERQRTLRRLTGEYAMARAPRTRRWVAAAALAAVVVGGAALWRRQLDRPFLASSSTTEYRTRATETMTVTLDDGSVAHLAPRSRLRVVRSRRRRDLLLEGRAFFAVHRDTRHPLVLHTARGLVEVVRGRFDVETSRGATRVLVVDGVVTMEASGGRVSSSGGHRIGVTDSTVTADTIPDLELQLAWMHGILVFRDTPLRTVARELQQLYGVQVEVPEAVADRTVTAWFAQQRLDDVLGVISRATFTSYTLRDGVAHLAPAPRGAIQWSRSVAGS